MNTLYIFRGPEQVGCIDFEFFYLFSVILLLAFSLLLLIFLPRTVAVTVLFVVNYALIVCGGDALSAFLGLELFYRGGGMNEQGEMLARMFPVINLLMCWPLCVLDCKVLGRTHLIFERERRRDKRQYQRSLHRSADLRSERGSSSSWFSQYFIFGGNAPFL